MSNTTLVQFVGIPDRLQVVALAWLDNKARRSESSGTADKYRRAFASYSAYLAKCGLTLDGPPSDVANAAQAWAGRATRRGEVARATFNHRLAVISSFYTFARKRGHIEHNPIDRIERGRVQEYASARPLGFEDVKARLAAIDRSTLLGSRDYALLTLALFTGRRASELAGLEWRDFEPVPGGTVVTWRRTKGGKVERNIIPREAEAALDAWSLRVAGDSRAPMSLESSVWRALSPRGTLTARGITTRAVSLMCLRRLGTSKVHAIRHTFAHAMEESGAKVSEIQAALGHSNAATTSRYLQALRTEENKYAGKMAALYGFVQ